MQNRIDKLFAEKEDLLSIYFTAGYPEIDDTRKVLSALQNAGVDFVEIGMPFSDPLADGPVIQQSSLRALSNGISVGRLLDQLRDMRPEITMPVVLMGYINPVMHFGVEAFARRCAEAGVDGIILPDLPFDLYLSDYKDIFDRAFLNLYPDFIEQFNALLKPEARFDTEDGRLNITLRIYALMRMGITNMGQIAKFLNYSLQTVYNYKSKVKKDSLLDGDAFEEAVKVIGKICPKTPQKG